METLQWHLLDALNALLHKIRSLILFVPSESFKVKKLNLLIVETTGDGTYSFHPARDGIIENNIIYTETTMTSGRLINIGSDTAPETFTWKNNLWFFTQGTIPTPGYGSGTTIGELYNINPGFTQFPEISPAGGAAGIVKAEC